MVNMIERKLTRLRDVRDCETKTDAQLGDWLENGVSTPDSAAHEQTSQHPKCRFVYACDYLLSTRSNLCSDACTPSILAHDYA